jgi:hypothetical protein
MDAHLNKLRVGLRKTGSAQKVSFCDQINREFQICRMCWATDGYTNELCVGPTEGGNYRVTITDCAAVLSSSYVCFCFPKNFVERLSYQTFWHSDTKIQGYDHTIIRKKFVVHFTRIRRVIFEGSDRKCTLNVVGHERMVPDRRTLE